MIRLKDRTLLVETSTLTAEITDGFITSLRDKEGGRQWLRPVDAQSRSALQLVYASGKAVGFGGRGARIEPRLLGDDRAEIRFHGWDADGVIAISECPRTGSLLIEPAAYSSTPGVLACRWNIAGLADGLELVAPFYQGVRLAIDDELLRVRRWVWPWTWEAGLAILQGKGGGLWVHAQDTQYRYKAMKVGDGEDRRCLGFDTEAYGPLDGSLGAGGLCWRVNVFRGDWQGPAREYRDWLWRAYALRDREQQRKAWATDISLAISWCRGNADLLDALAARVDPRRVLIHFSNWRTDPYDENYPTYDASPEARAFIAKGAAMGYHIMPHCNSVDMDPTHPVYATLRDFQYRDVAHKGLHGWAWDSDRHAWLSVPASNVALLENRPSKVMVKIHPGLAMWRSILAESIQKGLSELETDSVFIDVTLCSYNLHNCLVENTTSTEGMKRVIDQVAAVRTGPSGHAGLAVGGEGLNEITMQGLSFGQAHLFESWSKSVAGLERAGGCPLNALLFGGLARTFGYSNLGGRDDEQVMRSRVHLSLGAIPTLTSPSAQDILQPSKHVNELLDMAAAAR